VRALIIEKRVQNLTRLTTCSSYTTLHYWRSNKCYFSNKTTHKLQFTVRPGVLVWFVYLASAKTSTRGATSTCHPWMSQGVLLRAPQFTANTRHLDYAT
jgi:hypothetical protein